jgi:transcriptional regulator GlxA family with amidase domain
VGDVGFHGRDPCNDERDNPIDHRRSLPIEQDACSIEAAACQVGFSPGPFRRRFREAVGMSLAEYRPTFRGC